ncbi:transcriptional regulator family: Fungal Specific TF [Penicillium citrinum]|uniref:Transcriptional regulator family: Fungal Specific TF n=1 Tax=Penicillium citrinum TaxID=5077 RepID=A0A9W9PFD8_PENCI|nr:transcriptional regulator family: Fungal Specific TF [Penicillium citrinum]KAJ5242757.1 transcriptional regulator family: Fungal Specific TF [Penicillium citrinum]
MSQLSKTVAPPHIIDRPKGAKVTFRDDSRFIASEYVGGFERYPPPQPESPIQDRQLLHHDAFNALGTDYLTSLFQSVAHSFDSAGFDVSHDFIVGPDTWHEPHIVPGDELLPHGTSNFARKLATRQYSSTSLSDPEQIFLLQTFVEEVGPWMESMDQMRHFTQILPYHTVDEPMLLKAFLACGAQHLSVTSASYGNETANRYYEMATQDLMRLIQDPNRDSVLCATAALVLAIYESIPSPSTPKINHTTGSRALIRECGWNAKTPSLGGACFWINICMELLNCLHNSWSLSWDPDTWGVDMNMDHVHHIAKPEDLWLHRIIYICGKVSDFRVGSQLQQSHDETDAHIGQLNQKLQDWGHLNSWCDQWIKNAPPSMRPLGQIQPWPRNIESVFPTIWMTKRPAIIAQFFYHTARILLARTHPMEPDFHVEMKKMQQAHAYDVCGIAAGIKDGSLSIIAIRCLSIAAICLDTREAQDEALRTLKRLCKDTVWHAENIENELRQHWNWPHPHHDTVDPAQMHNNNYYEIDQTLSNGPEIHLNLSNPLLGVSDFSAEKHPYQGFYIAPHHALDQYQYSSYLI